MNEAIILPVCPMERRGDAHTSRRRAQESSSWAPMEGRIQDMSPWSGTYVLTPRKD